MKFIRIFLIFCVFLSMKICLIDSLSHQEDLSIGNYFHLACLKLKVEKEFLLDSQYDGTDRSFQSFSSSIMNVNLCFRLCRRWIVLMNQNESQCFCFYVVTKFYEFENYFGEVRSIHQCTSNSLKIFSLSKHSYLLQTPTPTHDWSLNGCYYLQGIRTVHADFDLSGFNSTFGMDLCRKHCQLIRNTSFFSFFISMRKSCYCLPVRISSIVHPLAVRKPLTHCSFFPSIRSIFNERANASEIHLDTVVKIDVQRFCSSSFIFDRYFYLCFKFGPLDRFNNLQKLNDNEKCSPILIKTIDDWIYLKSFSFVLRTRTFIWIDHRSTYLLDELFRNQTNRLTSSSELCLVASRNTSTDETLFGLVSCSHVTYPGFTLCSQKPLKTILDQNPDLQVTHHASDQPIDPHWSCPSNFFLFNGFCYSIHRGFVDNLRSAEQICHQLFEKSSLLKFNTHEWSNVNGTRFFGRTKEDVLLELFYYQLEQQISNSTTNDNRINQHWLRILLADEDDSDACIIRYFTRSSGSFTKLHKCGYGGHPVCRTRPIRLISQTTTTTTTTSSTSTEETITNAFAPASLPSIDSSNGSIVTNFTNVFVSDEDLDDVETNSTTLSSTTKATLVTTKVVASENRIEKNYRPLLLITSGPLFAFLFLLIGIIILVRFIRSSRDSYSPIAMIRNASYRRKRYSSPTMSSTETSQGGAVLYTRLKSHSVSGASAETNLSPLVDSSIHHDDNIRLLPSVIVSSNLHENVIKEDDEEPFYAKVKDSQEK